MKKILAILCAVLMLASLAAAASAEEAPQTTTITTTVPSTYVLTIPATVEIPYGEKNATIGSVKVTGRITNDQYVKVTAETTTNFCLVNDSDSSARISYRPGGHLRLRRQRLRAHFPRRDFSAKEVNGNGRAAASSSPGHQRLCLGACRCRYLFRHHHLHGLSGNGQRRGLSPC